MNREQLEQYCSDHGWKLYTTDKYLCAEKEFGCTGSQICKRFEIGMSFNTMIEEIKKEDGYTEELQGEFPFNVTDELL